MLASKWDMAFGFVMFLRVLFGSLPTWVKATLLGLVVCGLLWDGLRRVQQRRTRVR
ncbi:hypothetical protein [Streptomyces sp. WAC06614]|uniref:hypothetical protein n=1 Tax=Streptomyces sp. WAC06614 TaxID=2487416 RepID=UPI00163CCA88|nr:hypothetical protein [Streptomyces sp. WAC06614]